MNNHMKASMKLVNAYKSMRKGDYDRAAQYCKEAAKVDPAYKGVSAAQADLKAAAASGVKENVKDDKDDEKDDDKDDDK
jgi:hypothetical protein